MPSMEEEKSQKPSVQTAPFILLPKSTNNDTASSLSVTMGHLSLNAASATPLPPSSPVTMSSASIVAPGTSPGRLRRTPSAQSLGSTNRPGTPTLKKMGSLSSLKSNNCITPPRSPVAAGRRASSNLIPANRGPAPQKPSSEPQEEDTQTMLTPAAVAREYLQDDLKAHSLAPVRLKPPQK